MMKILAIDTSCDDTSVAISDGKKIIANAFWSKVKVHNEWGGVVPSEAKRQHEEFLEPVIETVLKESGISLDQIDYFAVTYGPGLAIALEPGIDKAKELAKKYNKPLVSVNHMIAHIYANLAEDKDGKSLSQTDDFEFPALALTISGGHTDLYLMNGHLKFEHIGHTLDDAIGESFDKVGRMLGLGFPAGYKIEELAKSGNENRFTLPRPLSQSSNLNWSFSGLKTAVLYEIYKLAGEYGPGQQKGKIKLQDISDKLQRQDISDMAASFQKAAVESLLIKINRALEEYNPKMLIIGGGVIANSYLRQKLSDLTSKQGVKLVFPTPMWLCTDNAAMIASTAYFLIEKGEVLSNSEDINKLERIPNLRIVEN